jgi:chitodextrinase
MNSSAVNPARAKSSRRPALDVAFALLAGVLLIAPMAVQAQTVTLRNSDFEAGNSAWSNWGNATAVSAQARSGKWAMRVGTGSGGRGQRIVELKPNTTYRLSGWGKVAAAREVGWMGVTVWDGSGREVKHTVEFRQTAYTHNSVTFTTPASIRDAWVWVWKSKGASTYFYADDLTLALGSAPTPAPEPAPVTSAVQFKSQLGGSLCMDAGNMAAGARLTVAQCANRESQRFVAPSPGEMRAMNGLCIDAGRGNNGEALVLSACNGAASQNWQFTSSGSIRGIDGRVVDVWNATPGTHLIVWDPHGDTNQRWTRVSSNSTAVVNTPPQVSLTSPAAGASFTAPAEVSLAASAIDPDGSVSKVEFFAGATLIGTATSAPHRMTWNSVAAGSYSITARATDNQGAAATSQPVSFTVTAAPSLTCPTTIPSNAFQACYYDNSDFTSLKAMRVDKAINFDWGTGSPDPAIAADTFSATWRGNFSFEAGSYEFTVTADDGIRVYVGNQLVIDQWKVQAPTTYKATRAMSAGVHTIRVEYFENTGGALARLSWNRVAAADTTAPSVPTNLSATATSSSQIQLAWSASSDHVGVTGYRVYRNNALVGASGGTSHTSSGLAPSTTYVFQVSAVDAAGNESLRSTAVSATTAAASTDGHYPSAPPHLAPLAEHDLTCAPGGSCRGTGGPWWTYDPEKRITYPAVDDAPRAHPRVSRSSFWDAMPSGISPGQWGIEGFPEQREMYVSMWVNVRGGRKPDGSWTGDFQQNVVGTKFNYFGYGREAHEGASSSHLTLGNGTGIHNHPMREMPLNFSWTWTTADGTVIADTIYQNRNLDKTVRVGQWHHIEQHFVMSSVGGADGSYRAWVDGVLVLERTGMRTLGPKRPWGLTVFKWAPVYGGGGAARTREDWIDVGHVYVTGRGM